MESPDKEQWVDEATHVYVKTKKNSFEFSINSNTTILDIKKILVMTAEIPIDQQELQAVSTHLRIFKSYSPILKNKKKVKEVMSEFNTKCLILNKQDD